MKTKLLTKSELHTEVKNLDFDLKAETLAALLPKTVKPHFINNNYFERGYTKDIVYIAHDSDIKDDHYVHLSRLSFYDIFPERIFHDSYTGTIPAKEMAMRYKKRKAEEADAKKFFAPIENEIFQHLIAVETQETEILELLNSEELASLLSDIWQINRDIPKKIGTKILKALPFLHKISGNIGKIHQLLECLIDEEIMVTETYADIPDTRDNPEPGLLGISLITKPASQSYLKKIVFTIDPISKPEAIENFFEGGKIEKAMRMFLEYTMPFEYDYEINFKLAPDIMQFVMDDRPYSGRMGLSSVI